MKSGHRVDLSCHWRPCPETLIRAALRKRHTPDNPADELVVWLVVWQALHDNAPWKVRDLADWAGWGRHKAHALMCEVKAAYRDWGQNGDSKGTKRGQAIEEQPAESKGAGDSEGTERGHSRAHDLVERERTGTSDDHAGEPTKEQRRILMAWSAHCEHTRSEDSPGSNERRIRSCITEVKRIKGCTLDEAAELLAALVHWHHTADNWYTRTATSTGKRGTLGASVVFKRDSITARLEQMQGEKEPSRQQQLTDLWRNTSLHRLYTEIVADSEFHKHHERSLRNIYSAEDIERASLHAIEHGLPMPDWMRRVNLREVRTA